MAEIHTQAVVKRSHTDQGRDRSVSSGHQALPGSARGEPWFWAQVGLGPQVKAGSQVQWQIKGRTVELSTLGTCNQVVTPQKIET